MGEATAENGDNAGGEDGGGDGKNLLGLLKRSDGGLLALNFGVIALLTSAHKLDVFPKNANPDMLIAGIGTSLFYAILSLYFAIFGARATASRVRDRGITGVQFDPSLLIVGPSMKRILPILASPLLTLFIVIPTVSSWVPEAARQRAYFGYAQNGAVMLVIALMIALPFYLWTESLRRERARSESKPYKTLLGSILIGKRILPARRVIGRKLYDPDSTLGRLAWQIECIQGYRAGAAVLSLAAFMMGTGLALVNSGVGSIKPGISDSTAFASAGNGASSVPASQDGRGGDGNTVSTTCLRDKPQNSCQMALTVHLKVSTENDAHSGTSDHPPAGPIVVRLEGLENLKPTTVSVQPPPVQGNPPPGSDGQTHYVQIPAARGERGEKGDAGEKGPKGDKGDRGEPGSQGDMGGTGTAGLTWQCRYHFMLFKHRCQYVKPPAGTEQAPPVGLPPSQQH